MKKFEQSDLDFINFHRESNDNTKLVAKKLQKIKNFFLPKENRDNYCMCDEKERIEYKLAFYIWWDIINKDLEKISF